MNFKTYRTIVLALALVTTSSCGSEGADQTERLPAEGSSPVDGEYSRWEANMLTFGRKHCDYLRRGDDAFDSLLSATYYDADWVFRRIAEYTGDRSWLACAEAARKIYRDRYLRKSNGELPGYWLFPHGLRESAIKDGDTASREALLLLAKEGAFAGDETRLELAETTEQSREVAYAIMTLLAAEQVGGPKRDRLPNLVELALDHLDQWFVTESAPYVRPFMVALTAQALIDWYDRSGDPRILPALKIAADRMWDSCWIAEVSAFKYTDRNTTSGGTEPAPDLNLLIAPLYAWMFRMTKDSRYASAAEDIFRGGVEQAFLDNPKQFNQNYRWSFEVVK